MTRVTIEQGTLQGFEHDGVHGFKGIPYAAPISGENRWRPPQPPEHWSDVRDATQAGVVCQQPILKLPTWLFGRAAGLLDPLINPAKTLPMGDDCLNLNVWTPAPDPEAKLPVMFWIHGGGSTQGSGSMPMYDGAALAKKGVVVVNINYRLGLAGFLSAPDYFDGDFGTPNRGFLDMIAALRWVQQNISQFGGDPDQVTIFGESAGGVAISVLLASPASKGLFHRAIMMSGVPECGASLSQHQALAGELFEKVGIKRGDAEALSRVPPEQLVEWCGTFDQLGRRSPEKYGGLGRRLGSAPNALETEFQPVPILDAIASGQASHVDLMLGTTLNESRMFSFIMPGPVRLASRLFLKAIGSCTGPNMSAKDFIREYRRLMPEASRHLIREQVITDALFRRGTVRAAEAHAQTNPGRTFLYQFEWPSPAMNGAMGAMHGVELPLVFQTMGEHPELFGDLEAARGISEQMSDAWVNFAKNGTPSASGLPRWEAFESEKRASMVLNTRSEILYDTDREKVKIWGERQPGAVV